MASHIRVLEQRSELNCVFELLEDVAPLSSALLLAIADGGKAHNAIHAIWTGPEISCPIPESALPVGTDLGAMPLENGTTFPAAGEIAVVPACAGLWKGMPPHGFFDIGIFYGDGGRLLMPMGWIMGSVCARVLPEHRAALAAGCAVIRRNGACELTFERVA